MDHRAPRALDLMRRALVLLDEIPEYAAAARLQSAIDTLTRQPIPGSGNVPADDDPALH